MPKPWAKFTNRDCKKVLNRYARISNFRHSFLLHTALALLATFFFSGSNFVAYSASSGGTEKLDALLKLVYNRYETTWKNYAAKSLPAVDPSVEALRRFVSIDLPSSGEPVVPLLVTVRDGGEDLARHGFQVQAQVGDVVTTSVPLSWVPALASLPSVVFVEASTILQPEAHDVSVPETMAPQARQTLGRSGRGVIVAILDSGIDWRHDDFRHADGRTRIKYLWDMTDQQGPEPRDMPGSGGTLYTEEQINAALAGSASIAAVDNAGHGTHVAGTAGGNGRATTGRFPAGTYAGMALEANLIIIKRSSDDSAVIKALQFLDNRSAELNMPYVVNMSFGSQLGAHDGTSAMERAIDSAVGPGKPGKVVIKSAGNDGGNDLHASGTIPANGSDTVRFTVPAGQASALLDLWYGGSDSLDVTIVTPTNLATDVVKPGQDFAGAAPDGTLIEVFTGDSLINNSRRIVVNLGQTRQGQAILAGTWSVRLQRTGGSGSARFDAWLLGRARFADHIDPSMRISIPGTARNVITVAAYNTKVQWTNIEGRTLAYRSETLKAKATFSSPGPTRDGRQKPDIAAPGQGIVSALSTSAEREPALIMPDDRHQLSQGTSMAAPHVTGAVALLLAANPGLDAAQVKDILTNTARSDDFTGRVPNRDWGFGKMDVLEAIRFAGGISTQPPPPPPANPVITSIDPALIRPGTTIQMALNGSNFSGSQISVGISPSSGFRVNQAASASASRINVNMTVDLSVTPGNYQVVAIIDGRQSNPAVFRVEAADAPSPDPGDPFEPNDAVETSKPLPADGRVVARIDPSNDLDYFKFPATRGRKVTFDIDARVLTPPSDLDSVVGVFDKTGNLLAFNDDQGSSFDSLLEWTPGVTDTYFVVVAAAFDSETGPSTKGPYVLKVSGHAGDVRADQTPPIFDAGDFLVPQILNTRTELFGTWFAADPESGIDYYEYAVGTTPGGTNLVPFTRTVSDSVYLPGLNLSNGSSYFFTVRAVNGAGLRSAAVTSPGIRIDMSVSMNPIYFPRVVARPGSFTGIAASNATPRPVQIIYRLFDNSGNLVLDNGITNPIALVLRPFEQMPLLSTELFGARSSATPGWVEVQTTDPDVKAFFLYGANDLSFLDGADVSGQLLTDFTFHRVQEAGDDVFTVLSIVNPNDREVSATAELRSSDGREVSRQNLTIGPKSRLVKLVRDLFPGVTEQIGGSIRVRSTLGMTGFELFASEAVDVGGINPQPTEDTTRSLQFGHFAAQGIWFTDASITNPNDNEVEVELSALAEPGTLITGSGVTNPVRVRIPARGQFNGSVSRIFGFTGPASVSGYLSARVVGGSGGVFGHVVFGTTNNRALAALAVQTRGSRNVVFSQLAQIPDVLFTGVTALNPENAAANIRTDVFDADGNSLGFKTEILQAGEKKARLIDQIVPAASNQAGGYIRLTSDRPLISFELFGDYDGSFLSAVPPQPISDTAAVKTSDKVSDSAIRRPGALLRRRASGMTQPVAGSGLFKLRKGRQETPENPREGWIR